MYVAAGAKGDGYMSCSLGEGEKAAGGEVSGGKSMRLQLSSLVYICTLGRWVDHDRCCPLRVV